MERIKRIELKEFDFMKKCLTTEGKQKPKIEAGMKIELESKEGGIFCIEVDSNPISNAEYIGIVRHFGNPKRNYGGLDLGQHIFFKEENVYSIVPYCPEPK